MMARSLTKVLLVEDNPGDVRLVQNLLIGDDVTRYAMVDASDLEVAKSLLLSQSFDVVLLDLGLPHTDGMETLNRLMQLDFEVPIIVLTGELNEERAIELIKAGAQDYLRKGAFDRELLRRSVDYAIERFRLNLELAQSRREAQRQRELVNLEALSTARQASVTADSFGEGSLRSADPEMFELLVEEYGVFILDAIERRVHGNGQGLERRVQDFAQRLGAMRAKPKDLTEIHVSACRAIAAKAKPRKREAISAESQLLLIEAMGYIALYYRTYLGLAPQRRAVKEPMNE